MPCHSNDWIADDCLGNDNTVSWQQAHKPLYIDTTMQPMQLHASFVRKTLIALALSPLFVVQATLPTMASGSEDNRYLDMDLVQLMQVTVTSVAKKPQTLADTPAAVYVISQEDIRRSGATSIPQALAMAPGLQVAQISASKWAVSSRGFGGYTSNKLLVLMDGRSVYSPAYSGVFWDMQNTLLEDIDRIEVIRGPGATVWGANAVNGVINIITKKAQDTQGTLLRASAGTEERANGAVRYGGKMGENAFARFYVTGNNRDSNELAGDNIDANDDWHNTQTGFRMDGTVGSTNQWTLQGDLFDLYGHQISFPFWQPNSFFPQAKYGDHDASGGNLIGSWQHTFANRDKLTVKSYYDANDRSEDYYGITFRTVDFDLQYETSLGERNNLTMGTGYRRVDGTFGDTFQVQIPDQTTDLYSAFLQDEINLLSDRLWLTLGMKYEHNTYTGNEWQPTARLLWKPETDHTVWGAVSRAVRTPSMVERSGSLIMAMVPNRLNPPSYYPPLAIKLNGNPDFDVETLMAYELGYRWQARRDISFDLALFYNDYNDIYDIIGTPANPLSLQFGNTRQGESYGLELAANWQARSWLNFALTYSYLQFDLETKNSALATAFNGNGDSSTVESSPQHQVGLRSSFDISDQWQWNTWLRYTSAIKGRNPLDPANPVEVDAMAHFDVNLIWKPVRNFEMMLAGQNLFNSNQLEYVSELITPPTEIDRSVYLKLTWNF